MAIPRAPSSPISSAASLRKRGSPPPMSRTAFTPSARISSKSAISRSRVSAWLPDRISAVEQKKQSMLQRSCQEISTTRGGGGGPPAMASRMAFLSAPLSRSHEYATAWILRAGLTDRLGRNVQFPEEAPAEDRHDLVMARLRGLRRRRALAVASVRRADLRGGGARRSEEHTSE